MLRTRARRLANRAIPRLARRFGFDTVPRGYYSVVANLDELGDEAFQRRSPMAGIEFDLAAQMKFAQGELGPFITELGDGRAAPWTPSGRSYGAVDGETAYAMVRHFRPRHVVELGSGLSSHVLEAACSANRGDGDASTLRTFDPYPQITRLGKQHELSATRAQDVPLQVFTELGDSDVLFVDTTHTVKIGSDVNRIILDVLPELAPGVVVHFHDIFLPGEYHRAWIEGGWHWGEQYLLQAFLAMNPSFEVLWGSAAQWAEQRTQLEALVPSLRDHRPSSFWIRRRSAD